MERRKAVVRAAATIGAALMGFGMSTAWAQTAPLPNVIIKYKDQTSTTATAASRIVSDAQARYGVTLRLVRTLPTGGRVMQANRVMTRTELQNLVTDLSKDPSVISYAHQDTVLQKQMTPNDPRFNEQWHFFEATGGIDLQRAWDLSSGAGVRVAVLDTGFRPSPDLMPNLIGGYDFISDVSLSNDGDGRDSNAMDPGDFTGPGVCGPNMPAVNSSWHGTHVAGVLAAVTNNGVGVAGVAYGAKVVPIRVVGRCGALISDVAEAAIWAAGGSIPGVPANPHPAKVLNMSLSAPGVCDPTSQAVINIIRSMGAVIVAAAGNDNIDAANSLPANCDGVITVAATTRQGGKASYSNFGESVALAAPGGDTRTVKGNGVLSIMNFGTSAPGSDGFEYGQGTSVATPQVAGVAALMLNRASMLKPDQIESILRSTARAFPATCNACGEGILDAHEAVSTAANLPQGYAYLRGGAYEPKFAGRPPTFIAEELGFIVEYRLVRRNSSGAVAQEFRQSTPVFNNLPAVGCVGESNLWTLTTVDAQGRTDSWTQRTTYFYSPLGTSIPCGR